MKNKNKNLWIVGVAVLSMIGATTATAANITWNAGDGIWEDANNWTPTAEYPGQTTANNNAVINNGSTVTVSTAVPQKVDFDVGGGSTVKITSGGTLDMVNTGSNVNGATIDIASGGTLTRNGDYLFVRADGATDGVVKMTGGTLSSAAVSRYVFSAVNTSASVQGTSRVDLSGTASFGDINTFMYFSDTSYMDSVFSITGSGVTVGGRDLYVRPKYDTSTSTLEFIMDASGVSSFDSTYKMQLTGAAGSADLSVDVTGRGAGLFTDTLADYGSLIGTFGTIDVVGSAGALSLGTWGSLSEGEYAIEYAGTGGIIELQYYAIPEPATIGMLGLGAFAVLFVRRYAKK